MSRKIKERIEEPGTIYCDRDPRDIGCRYWKASGEYLSEGRVATMVLLEGWGLEVKS